MLIKLTTNFVIIIPLMTEETTIIDLIPPFISEFKEFWQYLAPQSQFQNLKSLQQFKGGTCTVSKLEYPPGSNQFVAYKILEDKIDLKSFIREVHITNQVSHPCTSELIAFNLGQNNSLYVVTKFYSKGTLQELLTPNKSNPSAYHKLGNLQRVGDATQPTGCRMEVDDGTPYTILMYGIARGLKYMHELNFFHRDIKPLNIFIDQYNIPHLADFGYSKPMNDNDSLQQSRTAGTLTVMAPEVINLKQHYGIPSDVYSLALVFYSLTEAEHNPIKVKYCDQLKQLRCLQQYHSRNNRPQFRMTPKPLQELIQKMWDSDPNSRPTMKEVCAELEKPELWFPKTNPKAFTKFKERIDEFEASRILSVRKFSATDIDNECLTNALLHSRGAEDNFYEDPLKPLYSDFRATLDQSLSGNAQASYDLGLFYITGYANIPKDYVLAWTYLEDSVAKGYELASAGLNIILNKIYKHELKANNQSPPIFYENFDIKHSYFQNLKSPKSKLIFGMICEAIKEYEMALRFYSDASKQGRKEALGRVGGLLVKLNKIPQQRDLLLQQCLANDKIKQNERIRAQLYLGVSKLNRKQYDAAISLFEQMLEKDHPDAALLLAAVYHQREMMDKAAHFYQIAADYFSYNY